MPCYYPLNAWRSAKPNPETGKRPLVFGGNTTDLPPITLPCGRCIGCRLERSRQWAVRCVHEASMYEKNCFITLTFNDENLNSLATLDKADFQKFMKRLRKKYGKGVRYFHCGEYGDRCLICHEEKFNCKCERYSPGRPHHHACLFNFDFDDKILWQNREGNNLYRSKSLEELWPFGFCTIGAVTFESAAYVARYVVKKITGDPAKTHYNGRLPEYCTMSRGGRQKPGEKNPGGIGQGWIEKFKDDVYPWDNVIIRGKSSKVPKYYDKIYELTNPAEYGTLRKERIIKARDNPDNTPRRLNTRADVQRGKMKMLPRTL